MGILPMPKIPYPWPKCLSRDSKIVPKIDKSYPKLGPKTTLLPTKTTLFCPFFNIPGAQISLSKNQQTSKFTIFNPKINIRQNPQNSDPETTPKFDLKSSKSTHFPLQSGILDKNRIPKKRPILKKSRKKITKRGHFAPLPLSDQATRRAKGGHKS